MKTSVLCLCSIGVNCLWRPLDYVIVFLLCMNNHVYFVYVCVCTYTCMYTHIYIHSNIVLSFFWKLIEILCHFFVFGLYLLWIETYAKGCSLLCFLLGFVVFLMYFSMNSNPLLISVAGYPLWLRVTRNSSWLVCRRFLLVATVPILWARVSGMDFLLFWWVITLKMEVSLGVC